MSFVLACLTGISVVVGHQQPVSPWLAELHLNDCELPCWNGIVPGQTSFADARKRVEETYDDAHYLVEKIVDGPGIFWLRTTNRATGYGLVVGVLSGSPGTSDQGPVQAVIVEPLIEEGSNLRRALIPDLYSLLGDVEGIAISNMGSDPPAMLFYRDYQVGVTVSFLPCQKVLLGQEIAAIFLYDSTFLEDKGWTSGGISKWRGFGRCYQV